MTTPAYVVVGEHGCYSDATFWLLAVCSERERADALVARCESLLEQARERRCDDDVEQWLLREHPDGQRARDHLWSVDGPEWSVVEVPTLDGIPAHMLPTETP